MEKFSLESSEIKEHSVMIALYAEMVLDKALRDYQMTQLHKQIDLSLTSNNKEEFLRLTEQLKGFHNN